MAVIAAACAVLLAGVAGARQILTQAKTDPPDLVVKRISGSPVGLRPGDPLTVRDRVFNRGRGRAGKFSVGYYLARKPTGALKRIGRRKLASLGAKKGSSKTTTFKLPAALATGTYRLTACADDATQVSESDETNNCKTATGAIQVVPRDTLPPTSHATAPPYTNSTLIHVDYSADGTGSPVARVELWVRKPGSSSFEKAQTDSAPATSAHRFDYTAVNGEGTYAFYTRAYDRAGNVEAAPAAPDASTALETVAPISSANAPGVTNAGTIRVDYTADGTGSPLQQVELWVRTPGNSSFALVATDSAPSTAGHFDYVANGGDGDYGFYTVAVDRAGNREAAPGAPDKVTTLDTLAPTSSATATSLTNSTPITVSYTADGTGTALSKVELWVRRPGDSGFSKADEDNSPSPTGSHFTYTPNPATDGDYAFATRAYDQAGNVEAAPSSAEATTTLDTTPPAVTITQPADQSTTDLLNFAGALGGAQGDAQAVTLKIYPGGSATGTPVQTLTPSITNGHWSVLAQPLEAVTYTAAITQQDSAGNTGTATSTFTVPTTVLAAGDIAGPPAQATCETEGGDGSATSPLIQMRSGTVLALGDNEYEDKCAGQTQATLQDYFGWYDHTWGLFRTRTMPVPGNHEYPKTGTGPADGYFGYFSQSGNPSPAPGDPSQGYYSFNRGDWHIVALNSNNDCVAVSCTDASDQGTWLKNDLDSPNNQGKCILAYWHHPVFSSSASNGPNNFQDNAVRPLFNILQQRGADIILNGHQHNYERFDLQDANGNQTSAGVREFVVGTGGRSHKLFGGVPNAPNTQFQDDTHFGILDLTLGIGSYQWRFWPEGGGPAIDPGPVTACHHQPPPGP